MDLGALLGASIILFTGLALGKLISLLRFPNVTGYLIGGLLIGPSVLGIISDEMIGNLEFISQISLAFIAFSIGLSFKFNYLKRMGLTPFVITILEATLAVLFVQIVLFLAGFELPLVLVLGSIAAATAPAATVMVIRQYRAKGPVTDMLLSVVAIDDAVAIVLFGFSATIAQTMIGSVRSTSLTLSLLTPIFDIIIAIIIGVIVAVIVKYLFKVFTTRGGQLSVLLAGVLLTTGLAIMFNVSDLLANMALGLVVTNISLEAQVMDDMIEYITPPIYMMFFVLSGAKLQLNVITSIGLIGIIYIVFRVAGKIAGARLGAEIMKTSSNVKKYLGPMLIPQAGVAIGLATSAEKLLPEHSAQITAVVLVATLIYELVGPVITKISLQRAGEISDD